MKSELIQIIATFLFLPQVSLSQSPLTDCPPHMVRYPFSNANFCASSVLTQGSDGSMAKHTVCNLDVKNKLTYSWRGPNMWRNGQLDYGWCDYLNRSTEKPILDGSASIEYTQASHPTLAPAYVDSLPSWIESLPPRISLWVATTLGYVPNHAVNGTIPILDYVASLDSEHTATYSYTWSNPNLSLAIGYDRMMGLSSEEIINAASSQGINASFVVMSDILSQDTSRMFGTDLAELDAIVLSSQSDGPVRFAITVSDKSVYGLHSSFLALLDSEERKVIFATSNTQYSAE